MPILGGGARGRDSLEGGARGRDSLEGGGARGRDCDTERSSISTSSSATSSNISSGHWTQTSAVKLSKVGVKAFLFSSIPDPDLRNFRIRNPDTGAQENIFNV